LLLPVDDEYIEKLTLLKKRSRTNLLGSIVGFLFLSQELDFWARVLSYGDCVYCLLKKNGSFVFFFSVWCGGGGVCVCEGVCVVLRVWFFVCVFVVPCVFLFELRSDYCTVEDLVF